MPIKQAPGKSSSIIEMYKISKSLPPFSVAIPAANYC